MLSDMQNRQFYKEHHKSPTFTQIRRKVHHHVTTDDFVETFAICYLQVLQRDSAAPLPLNVSPVSVANLHKCDNKL